MRCQCLSSNLQRRCVGKYDEYVVKSGVHLQRVVCLLCLSEILIAVLLLSMVFCLYPHIFDMLLFMHLECSFV